MRHHTKDKGDLAVGEVIADLLRSGAQVCLPLSEHMPFDLIAVSPSAKEVRRVQVKFIASQAGAVRLSLVRVHADRHGIHRSTVDLDEVDAFAVYCPDTHAVYYVRRDEIPEGFRRSFALRITASKNGQIKHTRPAGVFKGIGRLFAPKAEGLP